LHSFAKKKPLDKKKKCMFLKRMYVNKNKNKKQTEFCLKNTLSSLKFKPFKLLLIFNLIMEKKRIKIQNELAAAAATIARNC
jgi:hypothetical protein